MAINSSLRASLRAAMTFGLPFIYAECNRIRRFESCMSGQNAHSSVDSWKIFPARDAGLRLAIGYGPTGGLRMANCSRRNFLKTGFAAGLLAGTGSLPFRAARATATDWVTLGKSGVKVTRLAFGTGTMSGRVQRELGQDDFTKLVRHAYDRGIRFFETAES